MTPPRASSAEPRPTAAVPQTAEEIAAQIEAFLAANTKAVAIEEGKVLFDLRLAKHALSTEHDRCTLQLWSEERTLARRITATRLRGQVLRLETHRLGQSRPGQLELVGETARRMPSSRETARKRYLRTIERALIRRFGDWKLEGLRAAMDLERSFGPAYVRGSLVQGQQAWAVIAVDAQETQATIDGILTLGVLWLAHCRESAGGKRLYRGLRVILPKGLASPTASRMAWLDPEIAQWELWELDDATEELTQRDLADTGNLATRLIHAPNEAVARERFSGAIARVMELVPEAMRRLVELRVRSAAELAFLLHGLEFARVRSNFRGESFNRLEEITFGSGANETPLTQATSEQLHESISQLFARRTAGDAGKRPDARDPLYRMQPERWLESILRSDVALLDARLNSKHVYAQVPAFAASDRGMLDLLSVDQAGRLAVIELKADEDLHLALQGLDYWIRVRWHHMQNAAVANGGLGEFQRHGYFAGIQLSAQEPKLYLVAPALRVHPATEVVLRHLSPRVEWELVALDERWRQKIKAVWRKRSTDPR